VILLRLSHDLATFDILSLRFMAAFLSRPLWARLVVAADSVTPFGVRSPLPSGLSSARKGITGECHSFAPRFVTEKCKRS